MFVDQPFQAAGSPTLNLMRGPEQGPPLLLLHGVLRCWQDYVPVLPVFSTRWQVFGLDHRGHGQSGRAPRGEYRVVDYVRDAVAVVRSLPEPAFLYGHSLGAMVAAGVAAEVPERVRGVVLEDPPFHTLGDGLEQTVFGSYFRAMRELAPFDGGTTEVAQKFADLRMTFPDGRVVRIGDVRELPAIRFVARCLRLIDPAVLDPIAEGEWLIGYDRDSICRRITAPTLLLQGDFSAGGMLTEQDADEVTGLIPDCTRVRFPGVGHLIRGTQRETTVRLVTEFAESLR